MVKALVIFMLFFIFLEGREELNNGCIKCHKEMKIPTEVIYTRYLLIFSERKKIKKAMFDYLVKPSYEKSVMPKGFLHRFGIKEPSTLSKQALEKELDEVLEYYDIKKRIKLKEKP